jgi:hypothetical protein
VEPIGISEREKLFENVFVIHGVSVGKRWLQNLEPPTLNLQSISNQQSAISDRQFKLPGGGSNSRPTPKAFGAALPVQMVNCEFRIFLPL